MSFEIAMARLPGIVHGVVVQITTEASFSSSASLKSRAVRIVCTGNFT